MASDSVYDKIYSEPSDKKKAKRQRDNQISKVMANHAILSAGNTKKTALAPTLQKILLSVHLEPGNHSLRKICILQQAVIDEAYNNAAYSTALKRELKKPKLMEYLQGTSIAPHLYFNDLQAWHNNKTNSPPDTQILDDLTNPVLTTPTKSTGKARGGSVLLKVSDKDLAEEIMKRASHWTRGTKTISRLAQAAHEYGIDNLPKFLTATGSDQSYDEFIAREQSPAEGSSLGKHMGELSEDDGEDEPFAKRSKTEQADEQVVKEEPADDEAY